jgi:hypothetical protein
MKRRFRNTGALSGMRFVIGPRAGRGDKSGCAEKLDDAEWHVQGDFPAGLPESAGSIPIRAYIPWAITRNLVSLADVPI